MEGKLDKIVEHFWINLEDMFDLTYDIVNEAYNHKKTTIMPVLITIGKKAIVECLYPIEVDGAKITDKHKWKKIFIERFIVRVYKYIENIYDQDTNFVSDHFVELFISNEDNDQNVDSEDNATVDNIFEVYFNKNAQNFHDLFNKHVTSEDVDDMWLFITRLVLQGLKFVHYSRKQKENGKYTVRYLTDEISNLKKWKNLMDTKWKEISS